ncbi:MAG: GntR family transcriptional regulator [Pseudomonadota bacterium]
MSQDQAGRVYAQIREMAEKFAFRPESQVNEVALAKKFGTSRTPVREALNRLVAEGYFTFQARKGFFVKPFNPREILSLYETRVAIETEATRLAISKSTDDERAALANGLQSVLRALEQTDDPEVRVDLDEQFHMLICKAADNPELERILSNLNSRVRFFRRIDLKHRLSGATTKGAEFGPRHDIIVKCIKESDQNKAVQAMRHHIERRREEATDAVARAFTAIYFDGDRR